MLPSLKIVPFLSMFALALGCNPAEQMEAQGNMVATSTVPRVGANAFYVEETVQTAMPVAHTMMPLATPSIMPEATNFRHASPVEHVKEFQRHQAPVPAPAAAGAPVPATQAPTPEVVREDADTTWMFFPRPQGSNMTPQQEAEWMRECQRIACEKMNAAQQNKVGSQNRVMAVRMDEKEKAALQQEVKQLFGKNQIANGNKDANTRPNGKNLCCCCCCCPCCCCCCPCCCCKCCCCKCCCCCCPCCCC